ncbi:MAG: cadherin domain-containing protein, partial [Pirellulaceae bacterium]|nr:cadherin domain-containing protein [Pirellulaceae bacterium]
LFADGRIRFDYGPGTAFQLSPTVGISSGKRFTYQLLAAYDSIAVLASARSVEWIPQNSIVDLGAYEFRGSSLDALPVTVLGSTPGAVHDSGLILAETSQIKLLLSEPLEQVGALSSSLFELRSDGGNGLFDDANDSIYVLAFSYIEGTTELILALPPGQVLGTGRYRLTIISQASSGLRDYAGLALDGDGNGAVGGNYVRTFTTIINQPPTLSLNGSLPPIQEDVLEGNHAGLLVASLLQGTFSDIDGPKSGLAVTQVDETHGRWQFALTAGNWQWIVPQLTDSRVLLLSADTTTRIRFLPSTDFYGHAGNLTYRGWDGSDGLANGTSILPAALVTNSLSPTVMVASQVVQAVNDAPAFTIVQSNLVTDEDAGDVLFTTWLGSMSPGPAEQDALTFVIDSVSNSDLFSILPTISPTGELRFTPAVNAFGSAMLELHVADAELSSSRQTLTITIAPVNDPPSDLAIASNIISENLPAGTLIGTLSATDIDSLAGHSFRLVSGAGDDDNAAFTVNGSELRTARKLDFESRSQLSIRVQTADSHGATAEKILTIAVKDLLEIEAIIVGDGSTQRSIVNQVRIVLDGLAQIDTGAFVVTQRGANGGIVPTTPIVSTNTIPGKTVITLLFEDSTYVDAVGSLKDGNYDLTISGALIYRQDSAVAENWLDADQDGLPGGSRFFGRDVNNQPVAADAFFRMLGDSDGDRDVDAQDNARFSLTYRKTRTSTGFNPNFDFDSDGDVDAQDYAAFSLRFRKTLPPQ